MNASELDDDDLAALRRAVFALRSGERRRLFEARLQVGDPDGEHTTYVVAGDPADHGLRTDIVAAMLEALETGGPHACWLTRTGAPETHDLDQRWLPAASAAFAEAGQVPRWLAVVTKAGWYQPFGAEPMTWQRLRLR